MRPVMVAEVVELLRARRVVVDMTVGAGGHAAALLDAGVRDVVGVDRDPDALRTRGAAPGAATGTACGSVPGPVLRGG